MVNHDYQQLMVNYDRIMDYNFNNEHKDYSFNGIIIVMINR